MASSPESLNPSVPQSLPVSTLCVTGAGQMGAQIAMLGAFLDAPVLSWDWGSQYGSLDVVADLLRGEYSVFAAEIELIGSQDTFRSGSALELPLVLYNWGWAEFWWESPLRVAVRIP